MLTSIYDAFSSYNESTLKANLLQGSTRITIHSEKKKALSKTREREIASMIGKQEVERARIRCEQVYNNISTGYCPI
jgi:hypothetical protein